MSATIEATGIVARVLGNNNYEVELEHGGKTIRVLCYLSGRMCQHQIKVLPGDAVKVSLPAPYTRGRITFRGKADA